MKNVRQLSSFYPITGETFRRRTSCCRQVFMCWGFRRFSVDQHNIQPDMSQFVRHRPHLMGYPRPSTPNDQESWQDLIKAAAVLKEWKSKTKEGRFFSLSGSNLELLERDLSGCSREISLTKFAFLNGEHKLKMSSYEHKRTPLFLSAWKWEISSSLEFLN